MELQLWREGGREGGRERNEGKDLVGSYTCTCGIWAHTADVEGGREESFIQVGSHHR